MALSPQIAQYVLIPWVGEVETDMAGVCPRAPILSSGESTKYNTTNYINQLKKETVFKF